MNDELDAWNFIKGIGTPVTKGTCLAKLASKLTMPLHGIC